MGFLLADLLIRFVAFKGRFDIICLQKIKEIAGKTGETDRRSLGSIVSLSDRLTLESLSNEGRVQQMLDLSEEICEILFEVFDGFFREFAQFMEFENWKIIEDKNREKSLKLAEKVLNYFQKKEAKRFRMMLIIFIFLLGCLMCSVFLTRNLNSPMVQKDHLFI